MVASLKNADLQIWETFKKSIDIYFKYVSIKKDKKNKSYNKSWIGGKIVKERTNNSEKEF
mgnify:CR=1 FL=1